MNQQPNEFDDLEAMLRQLPLTRPSASLDVRIRRLTGGRSAGRWIAGFIGASLAAAAAILIVFWPAQPSEPPTVAQAMTPAKTYAELVSTSEQWQDEGIVGYVKNGPVRQYRVQSVQELASASNAGRPRYLYEEQVVQVVSEAY